MTGLEITLCLMCLISQRNLVFRPDKMDETVPHTTCTQTSAPSRTVYKFHELSVMFHLVGAFFYLSLVVRKPFFAYAKTKTQISFAVTAKLISAFVFATRMGQPLFFLNRKFQASSYLLWLYSPICVGPGRKSRRPVFSQRGSFLSKCC